jgi:hypothetical protein
MKQILLSLTLLASISLYAQKKNHAATSKNVMGIWELITVKSVAADSTVTYPYGENPVGSMLLTRDGYYSVQIYKAARAKISSGNKSTTTAEENIMLVKGSNAHYGIYSVDLEKAIISFKPEHAFFPNWEGQELNQHYTLQGEVLTYSSEVSTFGASKSIVVWRRK